MRCVTISVKSCKSILCCVKQCKCKCKNKYIYRILNVKKCDFYMSRGDLIKVLAIGQPNGPLPEKKTIYQSICALGCTITNLIN
jgi:hypothetical protein